MLLIAFITGANGQDGSELIDFLLAKNYHIWGLVRKTSSMTRERIDHLRKHENLKLRYGDVTDISSLSNILAEIRDYIKKYENSNNVFKYLEVYSLAAMSHVKVSFDMPIYTGQVDGMGVMNLLEAIRNSGYSDKIRIYQASTSELYGKVQEIPQTETTPMYPRSPYAVAKLYAFWAVKNYREAYGLYAVNGILFNHEGPRRGENFLSRKVTLGLANILAGKEEYLTLGNLHAQRDWGHSKDYVEGMWLMLQPDTPDDYVLSSNETHTVKEFVEKAFKLRGFDIEWRGSNLDEVGYDKNTGRVLIKVDERYFRPTEVDLLLGDSTKARRVLKWSPKYTFDSLIHEMVENDCKSVDIGTSTLKST